MIKDERKNQGDKSANAKNAGKGSARSLEGKSVSDKNKQATHRVRLPGFITDEEIGLGDVIKRTTSYFGIKPCGGCERRAVTLNRWLAFTHRQRE
jgi:hypothetical protein